MRAYSLLAGQLRALQGHDQDLNFQAGPIRAPLAYHKLKLLHRQDWVPTERGSDRRHES
ncbi:hypothetical protein SBV1_1220027 [Verrucomicrobia bacterium]|nr:hypothetical protein SBV1_1220027 [Verrucomicrobiota bacterium]